MAHNYWLVVLLVTPAYSLVAPGVEQGRELQVRRAPARRFARAQLAVNTHTDCNGEFKQRNLQTKGVTPAQTAPSRHTSHKHIS